MLSLFRTKKFLLKKKKYNEAERLLRRVKAGLFIQQQSAGIEIGGNGGEVPRLSQVFSIAGGEKIDYELVKKKALDFVSDKSWEIRNMGVKLLGEIRCREGIKPLCELLLNKKEVGFVRRNSAKALGKIGLDLPEVIDALVNSMDNSYWEIRTEAIKALGILVGKNKKIENRLIERLFGKKSQNLISQNGSHRVRYKEKNLEVREAIAETLGEVGVSHDTVLALKHLLTDDIWMVRSKALNSLAQVLGSANEEFKKIASGVDLTCESFVPVFPLKDVYSKIIKNDKVKK